MSKREPFCTSKTPFAQSQDLRKEVGDCRNG